ncbi:copper amine oxidase N-terminal domain-containing protein [Heliorestis convoluta]|uniref:Copper amine oxidase N-terminal domain-containing protein n=1 Tax=Heliorestis convoluta TaxID=356322 RepID=A0A5Q2MVM0_9FIRM|nr:copper amine oxidase N-terminal domain-containing protein [Heliorestis convoluta]QGG46198.1 copper amine oxidase N-terminal domain-containing protein [Heliorestis convoluta]
MRKVLLASALALALLFAPAAMAQEGLSQTISVYVDDQLLQTETAPVLQEGRVLLPYRAIGEKLGATLEYIAEDKTVVATKGDTIVSLVLGEKSICINGDAQEIDVPAQIIDDRTMVPVRALAQAFHAHIEWENGVVRIETATHRAMDLLVKSTAASAALDSYTFEGQIVINTAMTGLPEEAMSEEGTMNMDMNMTMVGYYEKPDRIYVKNKIIMPELEGLTEETLESISTETYSDGNYLYMRMTFEGTMPGMDEADQWMRYATFSDAYKELAKSAQDPLVAVEQMMDIGIEPIYVGDSIISGQKYYVIQFEITEEEYSNIMEFSHPFTNHTPQSMEEIEKLFENLELRMAYTYYINSETYLAESFTFEGMQKLTVDPGITMIQAFTGTASIKNLNEPVTFPIITDAIDMAELMDLQAEYLLPLEEESM